MPAQEAEVEEGADGADLAEDAGADDLDDAVVVLAGVDLGADLGDAGGVLGGLADGLAFGDVEGHGLLEEEVLAGLEGGDGLDGVPMGRRGDDDGVEFLVFEEFAEVAISGGRSLAGGDGAVEFVLVDVADGGDAYVREAEEMAEVPAALGAEADEAEIDLLAGRRGGLTSKGGGGQPDAGGRSTNMRRNSRRVYSLLMTVSFTGLDLRAYPDHPLASTVGNGSPRKAYHWKPIALRKARARIMCPTWFGWTRSPERAIGWQWARTLSKAAWVSTRTASCLAASVRTAPP